MQLDRVLFIGAHTDDIELFAGGLLARVLRQGQEARLIVFSSHRSVTNHEQARQEFFNNMQRLNLSASHWLLYDYEACTGQFQRDRSDIYRIVLAVAKEFSPTLVVTHARHDTNQDHQQVHDEVVRSLKGRCSIVGGEYPFNQIAGSAPDLFISLEEKDIALKVELIVSYESQKASHRRYFDPRIWQGLARLRGAEVGAPYAEGFFIERAVISDFEDKFAPNDELPDA